MFKYHPELLFSAEGRAMSTEASATVPEHQSVLIIHLGSWNTATNDMMSLASGILCSSELRQSVNKKQVRDVSGVTKSMEKI